MKIKFRYIAILAFAVVCAVGVFGIRAADSGPPMPVNLEVISATEDSVTIAWGPSPPGPFTFLGSPKKNQVKIGWGESQDSRGPITYTIKKDGTQIDSGFSAPAYIIGVGAKTKSFRACVTATNSKGQNSTESCGTFTKQ